MKSFRSLTVAIVAIFVTALNAFAGDPTGTWTFKTEGKERSLESTLTLHWENNQLTGTMDNRAGKAEIRNAKFVDDQLSFTVERTIGKRLRKKTFIVNYAGKLEGDTIRGTIQTTGRDKQPVSLPWEAQRVK
jgi:hypothetical protein